MPTLEDNNGDGHIRVGIMGAGIAGCCLAIGLLKNPRLDVHVYERYNETKAHGSGLALHANALRSMDLISPAIKKAYFRKSHYMANEEEIEMATQFILAAGDNASELVAELGRAKGRRTVHRAHLIQGLMEDAIPAERIHYGKKLSNIEEDPITRKVITTFNETETETFDVVFGSEGVSSITRKFILGPNHPAATPVNHEQWRLFHTYVRMEDAKKVVPNESIEKVRTYCLPVGYINGIPVDLGQTFSICCYQRDEKCPVQGAPFNAKLWKGYMPEVDALISCLERSPGETWILQDHDHAPTYAKGHVAMIGDAAHATFPHAGNGAAQAIEDCAVLAGIFSSLSNTDEIDPALQAFDVVRRPRSQRVIDITRRFGILYSKEPDDIDVNSMKAEMKEGGMFTNGVDMEAQVKTAMDLFEEKKGYN
ncbi:hypothetical protein PFICI_04142 [Pestalotiopsis fici W106-1]|uniref:FAD-binding domain-containing protein n=1 Tax=Pestalotiopsis fici (strain W106-1 / CGMCC3.15140) TaxID=1229662 RepID=W3XKX2_PESFW|nr:uncharacterized protein PFICI_04142 [Pestalotiopsis fici W106-1]ETS86117.1 hypothetical protein PFICI_04142 [Pestalotiopsis fici W106-1]